MTQDQLAKLAAKVVKEYEGDLGQLESAIGMMFVCQQFGWRPMILVHDKKTIRNYERILDIKFREAFEPEGPLAQRSVAYRLATKLGNFWKRVNGEIAGARSPLVE